MFLNSSKHDEYVLRFYQSLSTPVSLACALMYKYGEHRQLAEKEFHPEWYMDKDFDEARDDLAAVSFLKKAEFLSTNIDTKAVALEKFFKAEEQCRLTNQRIRRGVLSNQAQGCLAFMKARIEQILGEFDPVGWIADCGWGPGATTEIPGRLASHAHKYTFEKCITKSAFELVSGFWSTIYPLWDMTFCVTEASKIITVPKNAKTDRTIAIEPGLNLWFQKGVGKLIRRKLRKIGVDLSDQSHNGSLARLGSKFGDLATVDFSAASDTISKALVEYVLPQRWFAVMDALRSHQGLIDGSTSVFFEKFSSMGNAFTFELETLLFYTLAEFARKEVGAVGQVSTYGDDVILPVSAYDVYASVAAELGFTVNKTKSYSTTPYRESCGSHWWQGYDIKPIFQKEAIHGHLQVAKFANKVRLLAHTRVVIGCDRRLRKLWELARNDLPRTYPRVPPQLGDGGLIVREHEEFVRTFRAGGQIEGFRVRAIQPVREVAVDFTHIGLYLSKLETLANAALLENLEKSGLYEYYSEAEGNNVSLPRPQRTRVKRVLCRQWTDVGPWI